MTRRLRAILVAVLVAISPIHSQGDPAAGVPQVRPVAALLTAVKDADQEQLKMVFSQKVKQQFDREGWDKALRTYQDMFKKEFGDYRLQDFSFGFNGDENRGTVSVAHKGRALPGLRVVNETNEWKIDER
jgi:hypothetical protein